MPLLEVRKLSFAYDDLQVLWDVDLTVEQGEIVSVVGANGAGKSTLLKNISRTVSGRAHTLSFEGRDLQQLPPHDVVELGVVQVPEARRIFPDMTVLENLLVAQHNPLMIASGYTFLGVLGIGGYKAREREAIEKAKTLQ